MPFLSFHIVEDGSELEMAAPSCPSSLSLPQSAWAVWIRPNRIVMASSPPNEVVYLENGAMRQRSRAFK